MNIIQHILLFHYCAKCMFCVSLSDVLASSLRRGVSFLLASHSPSATSLLRSFGGEHPGRGHGTPRFHRKSFLGRISPRYRDLHAFPLFTPKSSRDASHPDIATSKLSLLSPQILPGARYAPKSLPPVSLDAQ